MFATIAGPYPALEGTPEEALRAALSDQVDAGLGMVADGRVHRLDRDAEVDAVVRAWAQASDLVADLVAEGDPIPTVKVCLLGPLSLGASVDADRDAGVGAFVTAGVARVRAAILALHAAGAAVVQVDEPWSLSADAGTAEGRAWAAAAWAAMLDGVTGHVSLALPGGGPTALGVEVLLAAPFVSHLVDLIHGPDDWRVVGRLSGERGVILGVADLRSGRRDDKEVLIWASRHAAAMHGRGLARVGLTTSAGLERLSREAARARLAVLAETAALGTLTGAELAAQLDPRAIDARSAGLGRWEPRPRRRPIG